VPSSPFRVLPKYVLTLVLQVRWTRVPDLIEKRRVFMKGGWAYVPGKEQSSIIFREFDVQLEQAMEVRLSLYPPPLASLIT